MYAKMIYDMSGNPICTHSSDGKQKKMHQQFQDPNFIPKISKSMYVGTWTFSVT